MPLLLRSARRIVSKGYDSPAVGRVVAEARRAEKKLSPDARYALESWQYGPGVSANSPLETNPDIIAEITRAGEPVRGVAAAAMGPTVPVYRAQDASITPGQGPRSIFSWSFDPAGALEFQQGRVPRVPTLAEIEAAVENYRRRGFAQSATRKFLEDPNSGYGLLFDSNRNQLTDFGGGGREASAADLRRLLEDERKWGQSLVEERAAATPMYRAEAPVDQMFWVFPNALSREVIMRRDPVKAKDPIFRSPRVRGLLDDEE